MEVGYLEGLGWFLGSYGFVFRKFFIVMGKSGLGLGRRSVFLCICCLVNI